MSLRILHYMGNGNVVTLAGSNNNIINKYSKTQILYIIVAMLS